MREDFFEETAYIIEQNKETRKYNLLKIISVIFYALFVVFLLFMFFNFDLSIFSKNIIFVILEILLNVFPVVSCFLVAFFLGKYKKKFYNEFDYTFVSGSFRFSKVVMNKRRYPIVKFDCSQVEKIGYFGSDLCEDYLNNNRIKKERLTANSEPAENKRLFYMLVSINSERTVYILECTEKFIANILHYVRPTVWEREK